MMLPWTASPMAADQSLPLLRSYPDNGDETNSATTNGGGDLASSISSSIVRTGATNAAAAASINTNDMLESSSSSLLKNRAAVTASSSPGSGAIDSTTAANDGRGVPLGSDTGSGIGSGVIGSGVIGLEHRQKAMQLLFGVGGIYGAFLYYGSLQEDVFSYANSSDNSQFKQAWFLQVLESLANVVVALVGMRVTAVAVVRSSSGWTTPPLPTRPQLKQFAISGAAQVTAKAFTSLALANGLSFPVATLAKSGKMLPVMMGSLLLGGAIYSVRDYLQVAAIVLGTAIVSMGKNKTKQSEADSSGWGLLYIVLSLTFDGVTAGFQKRLQRDMDAPATADIGSGGGQHHPPPKLQAYDFMFWTNLFMCGTAAIVALFLGELVTGSAFLMHNAKILSKIMQFSACSAIGQSFIFYTLAHFDPLVLSTVTTTRKVFSVLLSIFFKGHSLSWLGWSGIHMACLGIASEMQSKIGTKKPKHTTR